MRRAKKPPPQDKIDLAACMADALDPAAYVSDALMAERRSAIGDDLADLIPIAIGEYLRRFPRARNNGKLWVTIIDHDNAEQDYCCFFCRESINCLPLGKPLSVKLQNSFQKHGELCAMRFLAGIIPGSEPQPSVRGWSRPRGGYLP